MVSWICPPTESYEMNDCSVLTPGGGGVYFWQGWKGIRRCWTDFLGPFSLLTFGFLGIYTSHAIEFFPRRP